MHLYADQFALKLLARISTQFCLNEIQELVKSIFGEYIQYMEGITNFNGYSKTRYPTHY